MNTNLIITQKMKKIIILSSLLLLASLSSFAQKNKRIKAYKVAHITEALALTPEEAERFWPVYNKYEEELHQYRVLDRKKQTKEITDKGGIAQLTEDEATEIIANIANLRAAIQLAEKEKYEALKPILSAKKILMLYRAEQGFKKKLLERLKERRQKRR